MQEYTHTYSNSSAQFSYMYFIIEEMGGAIV